MLSNRKTIELAHLLIMYSIISLLLTAFGLFGMALYAIRQRTKEIGIRKVNGATAGEILYLLNRRFIGWVGIAFAIAVPITWYSLSCWLENFVYRVDISIGTCLLSGGIDSPVAGYMIAKRGVKIDAVYFHAPPYTSERAKQKVVDLAKLVARYSGPIRLHVVNFTEIQLAIYEKCPHDELTIIMRRYMMKIAEAFARQDKCLGLITGESIGQVASQTMHSLAVTNEVCTMPVFRPLIGFDKQEIVDISEKIGTYETSVLPYEDCCTIFVAKHPVTKPNLNVIKCSERHLDDVIDEMMERAVSTAETIEVC